MEGTTGICMGWCMAPIYLARLGLSKELNIQLTESAGTWTLFSQGFGSYGPYSVFFPDNQLRWKKNNPRNIESGKQIHMPAWNFRHFDYEPMPILATAVNEMLLQSYDGSLRLFPAVLPDDTVRFSLAAENGIIISAEKNGDSFIASIECSVTQTCRLILPEYIDTHIYCYIVQGEHFKEIDYVANSNGTELEYLIPMVSGVRYFVSSEPVEKLVIIDGEHPIPNSLPKYCGISKLGEERMF